MHRPVKTSIHPDLQPTYHLVIKNLTILVPAISKINVVKEVHTALIRTPNLPTVQATVCPGGLPLTVSLVQTLPTNPEGLRLLNQPFYPSSIGEA